MITVKCQSESYSAEMSEWLVRGFLVGWYIGWWWGEAHELAIAQIPDSVKDVRVWFESVSDA